ncbi:MAG: hypothetical protein KDK51_04575 [Deltaproteobacteria bacterium]|nr:hypothetical protein [Deltaproteobacteria bacterium]
MSKKWFWGWCVLCMFGVSVAQAEILIKTIKTKDGDVREWNPAMAKGLAHTLFDIQSQSKVGRMLIDRLEQEGEFFAFGWGSLLDLIKVCEYSNDVDFIQGNLIQCYTKKTFKGFGELPLVMLRKTKVHTSAEKLEQHTVFQGILHLAQYIYAETIGNHLIDNPLLRKVERDLVSLIEGFSGTLQKDYAKWWPIINKYVAVMGGKGVWTIDDELKLNQALQEIGQEMQKHTPMLTDKQVKDLQADNFLFMHWLLGCPQVEMSTIESLTK